MSEQQEEQQHHYYASNAFGWGVGSTRREAIAGASRMAGSDLIKAQSKKSYLNSAPPPGLYTWSCRVDVPRSMNYDVEWYRPQGVPISDAQEHYAVNTKGHVVTMD